jgi:hypothetical protein
MSQSLMPTQQSPRGGKPGNSAFLTDRQVAMIDQALDSLGEFGEVRLVVEKRRLRFLVTVKSSDVLKLVLEDSP